VTIESSRAAANASKVFSASHVSSACCYTGVLVTLDQRRAYSVGMYWPVTFALPLFRVPVAVDLLHVDSVALRPTFGSNYLHVVLCAPTAFRRDPCSLSKVVTHGNRTTKEALWDHYISAFSPTFLLYASNAQDNANDASRLKGNSMRTLSVHAVPCLSPQMSESTTRKTPSLIPD
jgi:hypothetical protein